MITTMVISVPTGIKISAGSQHFGRQVSVKQSLLFAMSFVGMFVIGITGVMVAAVLIFTFTTPIL